MYRKLLLTLNQIPDIQVQTRLFVNCLDAEPIYGTLKKQVLTFIAVFVFLSMMG